MKYILAIFATLLAAIGFTVPANAAETPINQCVGTWSVVVGGLGNNDSRGFENMNQRVGYNSVDTRSGISELNRLIWDHSKACPGDRIRAVGHSGGAAVVHRWATENGRFFVGKASIVLLADPKRPAGPDGPGFAATDFPFNVTFNGLAGADANYGGLTALQVCNKSDHICNASASWNGYLNGTHQNYDFNVLTYPFGIAGQWYYADR